MNEAKQLYRRIEALFAKVPLGAPPEKLATRVVSGVFEQLGDALRLQAAQLYRRDVDRMSLLEAWGEPSVDLGGELPRRLASGGPDGITELPWFGATASGATGLLAIDGEQRLIGALVARGEREGAEGARFVAALSALHHGLDQRRHRHELEDALERAHAIQSSLLPSGQPAFAGFDIAALSVPARSVGGDLYDFIAVDDETLAITVADASGHGLPAALQARDVITGLRMGIERDFKIRRIIEKLNRVIHRSGLSSRFISLVFGELESSGTFTYVNAGHPPPLLLDDDGFHELTVGGTLLGPLPEGKYKLGLAQLERGASLALYTDGVIERGAEHDHEFGSARLMDWMAAWRDGPSTLAVSDLLDRLRHFGDGGPFEDDVTIVMVRRL